LNRRKSKWTIKVAFNAKKSSNKISYYFLQSHDNLLSQNAMLKLAIVQGSTKEKQQAETTPWDIPVLYSKSFPKHV